LYVKVLKKLLELILALEVLLVETAFDDTFFGAFVGLSQEIVSRFSSVPPSIRLPLVVLDGRQCC